MWLRGRCAVREDGDWVNIWMYLVVNGRVGRDIESAPVLQVLGENRMDSLNLLSPSHRGCESAANVGKSVFLPQR
jgi:hypothetical protein